MVAQISSPFFVDVLDKVEEVLVLSANSWENCKLLYEKTISPSCKKFGADLFEIAAPEIGEVVGGRKIIFKLAEDVGPKQF